MSTSERRQRRHVEVGQIVIVGREIGLDHFRFDSCWLSPRPSIKFTRGINGSAMRRLHKCLQHLAPDRADESGVGLHWDREDRRRGKTPFGLRPVLGAPGDLQAVAASRRAQQYTVANSAVPIGPSETSIDKLKQEDSDALSIISTRPA